jgi:hypothetical protein
MNHILSSNVVDVTTVSLLFSRRAGIVNNLGVTCKIIGRKKTTRIHFLMH